MKKKLFKEFFCLIFILVTFTTITSYAEMQTESLSIGGTDTTKEYSQNFEIKEIIPTTTQPEEKVKIIEVPVPVYNNYYNPYYYPNTNNYTRRIGPYGVYSNWGIGGYDYKGFAFDYSNGYKNKAIYVGPPTPVPPPPPPPGIYHPHQNIPQKHPTQNRHPNKPRPNYSR